MKSKQKVSKSRPRKGRKRSSQNTQVGNKSISKPIGISMNRRKSRYSFSKGRRPENLMMTCTFPMYTICANTNPSSGVTRFNNFIGNVTSDPSESRFSFLVLNALGGIGYQDGNLATSEVFAGYVSPMFELMSLNFVNYYLHELEFIYEPQSTTTVDDRLVFGYASDALHPLLKNSDGSQDISSRILALEDSVAFAPWESWRLNVSGSLKKDMLYVYDPVVASSIANQDQQYTARQVNRFSAFGCIAASASSTSTSLSQKVYGILYARIRVEYVEYCPIISGLAVGSLPFTQESRNPLKNNSSNSITSKKERKEDKNYVLIEDSNSNENNETLSECDCKSLRKMVKTTCSKD